MSDEKTIPTALRVVAALFILRGALSLVEIVVALIQGRILVDFGVLGLFIGPGLLRLSRTWRTWALVFTWMAMVGAPGFALLFLSTPVSLDLTLLGQPVSEVSMAVGVGFAVVLFLIALWQHQVLTHRDVQELFRKAADELSASREESQQSAPSAL